jgi:glycosyltransferase involved in cell wall biosynthesis
LFDHQAFSRNSYGGVSRYFSELYAHLICGNVDISILAPIHRNFYLNSIVNNSVYGKYLKKYPPKTTRLILKINQLISDALIPIMHPNIIHQTYYGGHFYSSNGSARILTVYDMIHELIPNEIPPTDQTSRLKLASVRNSDHVICISQNTKADLMNFFNVPEAKISVVYLGCDVGKIGSGLRQSKPFNNDRPYVLYVGNRFGYKNFKVLLEAYGALNLYKTHDLLIFGGGSLTHLELAMLDMLGIPHSSVKHQYGEDRLLTSIYKNAEVLVYPSIHEGFGLPPLEAMANLCPVISSSSSCMPEILGNAAIYFDPTSYEDLMIALMQIIDSKDNRVNYILKGEERSRLFTWKSCSDATLKIYKRFC